MLATETRLLRASVRYARDEEEEQEGGGMEDHRVDEAKRRVPAAIASAGRRRWELSCVGDDVPPRLLRRRVAAPPISRAYYKMREVQLSCGMPPCEGRTLHLCEAPGGFVQACADDASPTWRWCAVTLPDSIPPAPPEALGRGKGAFVFADVRDVEGTCDAVHGAWRRPEEEGAEGDGDQDATVTLVTADGACAMDHERLEEEHFELLVAQTAVAMRFLAEGGSMVVKFFEGRHVGTQRWIAYATTRFDRVSLIKPTTSRPTNSERYLVARGYDGNRSPDTALTIFLLSTLRPCSAWLDGVLAPLVRAMLDEQAASLEAALARAGMA